MAHSKLDAAVTEARRFLALATDYQNAIHNEDVRVAKANKAVPAPTYKQYPNAFPVKSGAVRRASMDLTRSLAALRKPGK